MPWNYFLYFAVSALLLWIAGAVCAWVRLRKVALCLYGAGLLVFLAFIVTMWVSLQRPPMRTLGETRLWYSFFLATIGFFVYLRWKYPWILSFSTLMALVFICINIFKPEIHTKALMPALQSPWFAPHVIVYMFAYALLAAATLMALYALFAKKKETFLPQIDQLVALGIAFLTFGMLFGALWAKEAWGHYWTWDPKETWAAATWFAYLVYLHFRRWKPLNTRSAIAVLLIAFCMLQMCWWGINYLPAAKNNSVHTYGSTK